MLALDTNVIVRLVTRDHPQQAARARRLVERNTVYVATTVILETEWVLRSLYNFETSQIVKALREFAGLPHVSLEDESLLAQALIWTENGMDFADALHLASAHSCRAFVTFDERLLRTARQLGAVDVKTP